MKKRMIGLALGVVTAAAMCMTANADELIRVGVINNDPNESGYRTANVKDLEETFSEENGFEMVPYYSLNNDEQIDQAKQMLLDGVDYLLLSAAATTRFSRTRRPKVLR